MSSVLREELAPLFQENLVISADEARAIAGVLLDVSESDGVHDEEKAMIWELLREFSVDLGDAEATSPLRLSPEGLARLIVAPEVRRVVVITAMMVAMADGAVSNKERATVQGYASVLGITGEELGVLERRVVDWFRSGDLEPLF
jgi:tellurite resistance protein